MRRPAGLVAAALAVLIAAPMLFAQGTAIVVEDWSKQPQGKTGIPDGWQGQTWGSPKYDFRIVAESSHRVIHLKSHDDGSTISKEIKVDVKQYPYLQWQWKAVVLPKGGDSRHKETDDQACQIYVTFPRFPKLVRSRIISYVWDTTAPVGTIVQSEKTSLVTYIVLRSGGGEAGKWITETRNVAEDFKKIHGQEPGELAEAVSISIDSNDTHDRAECFVGEIAFKKQG
ncbi:MAG TPA: DUF3047 domain-containing protein [Methylomirabilota bacterium]|nr:DUF3047 domain-containing protein [Methylomirabilota bacterium]